MSYVRDWFARHIHDIQKFVNPKTRNNSPHKLTKIIPHSSDAMCTRCHNRWILGYDIIHARCGYLLELCYVKYVEDAK